MNTTYEKGGSAGSKGVNFQVDLLQVFFSNTLSKFENWRLSTENKKAGKFDDVVLEIHDGSAILLQAKFKENTKKKITLNNLLSVDSKNDDFSVPKYFFSYEEVKKTFLVKNIVVCTNADVDKTALTLLKSQLVSAGDPLHHESDNGFFYTFKDEILFPLKEHAKNYHKRNLEGKNIDESVINDENLQNFLGKLRFYFNYPSGNNIKTITEKLLMNLKYTDSFWETISAQEVHMKIMDWFQQPKGQYLTKEVAKAMLCEIISEKYCQVLENHNIQFKYNDLIFENPKRIFHVVAESRYLLETIKVHQALKNLKTKMLIISANDNINLQRETVEAFGLPPYVFLVISKPKFTEQLIAKELSTKLTEILKKYSYKKIIFLDRPNSELARQLELDGKSCETIKESVTFHDLSKDTQEKLLKKKNIVVQGYDALSLVELFTTQNVDYKEVINLELLESLVRGEKIEVGAQIARLPEDISRFYVNRNFKKERETRQEMMNTETFSEKEFFDVQEKLVLISDSAGTGKSTVLTNLAMTIKKNNPHLWVIRINLNEYTKVLRDTVRKNKKSISIRQMLDSKDSTKFRNQLEEFVFSANDEIVLMVDGIDEISPDFKGLILTLLCECKEAPNFRKIFVATRPHLAEELKAKLQVKPFALEPFTKENQINFLSHYWIYNLKINDVTEKRRCRYYARIFINQGWANLNDVVGDPFTTVPLQLRMYAEILQENYQIAGLINWKGCKEYLAAGEDEEPELPPEINITELYRMFVDKKRDVFVDKENPSGGFVADQAVNDVFNNCLACYKALAVEVMLEEKERELFPCYQQGNHNMETNLLKIGIVQKSGKDLNFIHKTFAEYFFAEILQEQLQQQNYSEEFQTFFVEGILLCPEFKATRTFLDSLICRTADSFIYNMFENHQYVEDKTNLREVYNCNLLHLLAGDGCIGILQFILKHIDFKTIRNKQIHIKDLYKILCHPGGNVVLGRTVNCLKFLVERAGINIKDDIGRTPLHYAVQRLQVDMVKFLLQLGADINCADDEGRTALHVASNYRSSSFETTPKLGLRPFKRRYPSSSSDSKIKDMSHTFNLKIIEILVREGADIKAGDNCCRDALFTAIYARNTKVATYLLNKILETDGLRKDESVLIHMAARESGLKTLNSQMKATPVDIRYIIEMDKDDEEAGYFRDRSAKVPLSGFLHRRRHGY